MFFWKHKLTDDSSVLEMVILTLVTNSAPDSQKSLKMSRRRAKKTRVKLKKSFQNYPELIKKPFLSVCMHL